MERVVTINLNGNPYQLEEPAYDALRAYLTRAETALAANPDKAEIIRDLQQAVADKCAAYLSPSKSVINASEMTRILHEMGPVEGDNADQAAGAAPNHDDGARPQRRLYRIYGPGAWTGVSAGMAAYAGIDVAWVRTFWIVSAIFTGGTTALIYLVLIFAVPVATTSADFAAAHGAPFNAQEVIDRAKREYAEFTDANAPRWRANIRRQRRAWRQQMRNWRWNTWDYGMGAVPPAAAPATPVGYATRVFAGIGAFVFSVITAALLIAFLLAFFTFLGSGQIMGWSPPADIPNWLVIVVLCIAFAAISSPFSALRRTSYATLSGRHYGGGAEGLVSVLVLLAIGWVAWMYSPEAREMMEQAYRVVLDFANYWKIHSTWN